MGAFGICFDLVSQNGMCLLAAVYSNFLPQKSHFTLVSICYSICFASFFSYSVTGTFFAFFMLARNAKLCCFHFGTFPLSYSFLTGCFWVLFNAGLGLSNPSTYGALWEAESKAFLFDWNTFWHTFSCFTIIFALNILPHPIEHSTNSTSLSSYGSGSCWMFCFAYFLIYCSSKALKSFPALRGFSISSSRY